MTEEWAGEASGDRKFTVSVAEPTDCKRVLSIRIPRGELEREKGQIVAELRRDLKVPGFRKGKVPLKYIEKNYAQVIHGDAVRNLLPAVYEDALVREGIAPVGEPSFDNVDTEGDHEITFDVTVEVRPKVEVSGYQGVKVKVTPATVEPARVDEAIEHLRERMTTLRVVDRPVKPADVVLIDYGPIGPDGQVDAKQRADNYPVDLDSSSLMPEFKTGLVGAETGETRSIEVKYPDDFPEKDMAGTTKTFQVTVKEIKEKVVPELNADFARQVDEKFDDIDALRAQVQTDLEQEAEKRHEHDIEEAIIDQLIERNAFGVPDAMVDNYLTSVLEEDRRRRPDVEDEAEREREIRQHFREAAVRTIKKYFIVEAIKRQEAIQLDDGAVDARIEELATSGSRDPEQVRSFFANPERRRSLESEMLDRRVFAFLREAANVKNG